MGSGSAERNLLIERTNTGLARTLAQGAKLGRCESLTNVNTLEVLQLLELGITVSTLGKDVLNVPPDQHWN